MKKFNLTCYKGYLGDHATEYWTDSDWQKHGEYIAELKKTGEFGKPYDVELILDDNPLFDSPQKPVNKAESYRYTILDFNKDETI